MESYSQSRARSEELREFAVIGTGWDIKTPLGKFLGTVLLGGGGGLVFHVFEVLP